VWTDQRQPRQERSAPLHQVPPPRSHQPRGAPTVSPGRRQTAIYAYIGSASSSSKDAQCTQACCILVKASGVWLGHCSCCCVVHKAPSSVILRMCTAAAMDCTCTGRCNTVPPNVCAAHIHLGRWCTAMHSVHAPSATDIVWQWAPPFHQPTYALCSSATKQWHPLAEHPTLLCLAFATASTIQSASRGRHTCWPD
jgi:hypothetical protein